jgi:hypothetical protein
MMSLPPLLPATRNLLILGAIALVVNVVLAESGVPLALLAISPTPSIGWAWQWATHWLITGTSGAAVLFKLIELAIVFLMGSQYEAMAGPRRVYGLFVASVLGGALGALATLWITPYAPWGGSSFTTALVLALAMRAHGREVDVPMMGRTSPWIFVAGFGVFSLFSAFSDRYAPVAGVYAGSCAAAYVFERWVRLDGLAKKPAPKSAPPAKRGDPRFRVIEGGRKDDDERPEYLN